MLNITPYVFSILLLDLMLSGIYSTGTTSLLLSLITQFMVDMFFVVKVHLCAFFPSESQLDSLIDRYSYQRKMVQLPYCTSSFLPSTTVSL